MLNVAQKLGSASLVALLGASVFATPAFAEGRGPAPVVFAAEISASNPTMARPMDLRPGAAPVKFSPAPASAPLTVSPSIGSDRDGWSRPYAGPPYQVNGKWFVPMHEPDYDEVGIASWYGPGFNGELASSGETFDQDALTAAHPTLPIPSVVRVTNLENNRSVLVRLNDRGPYVDDRIIDLSRGTADALDVRRKGTAKVRVQYVGPAPIDPDAVLTERMFAGQPAASSARQIDTQTPTNVWTAELPPAAGMPDRPLSQASDEGVDRPDAITPVSTRSPVASAGNSGGYALQVGSFSDLTNAHKALADVRQHGDGYVSSAVVNGSQFYRVMLGPWPTQSKAADIQSMLAGAGRKALVVDLD